MKPAPWYPPLSTVSLACLFALALGSVFAAAAQAQFSSPPDQGTPKGTAGGGSRPINVACLQQSNRQETLLALSPTQSVGLTIQSSPTFWVYVPHTTAKTLEFSLSTPDQVSGYQVNLPVQSSGLLKITLPAGIALTSGQLYSWKAALICNPDDRNQDWIVGGSIQQQPLNPTLQRQLAAATPEWQVTLYAQAGFWYEALNTYLDLRQSQPQNPNLTAIWATLVQSGGLSALPPELLRPAKSVSSTQASR